jgi:DNA polymerase-1
MKVAMINVYNSLQDELDKSQVHMLLQVHDELVLEVKKDKLNRVARLIKEEMETAVELDVPLIVDLQVGDNWRDKEDYEVDLKLF